MKVTVLLLAMCAVVLADVPSDLQKRYLEMSRLFYSCIDQNLAKDMYIRKLGGEPMANPWGEEPQR